MRRGYDLRKPFMLTKKSSYGVPHNHSSSKRRRNSTSSGTTTRRLNRECRSKHTVKNNIGTNQIQKIKKNNQKSSKQSRDNRGWKNTPLSEIADIDTLKTLKNVNPKSLIHIGLEHIISNSNTIKGHADIQKFKTYRLFRQGDILYGRLSPHLNKVWLATTDGHCSTDILPIVANAAKVLPKFLLYAMTSPQFVWKATMASSGVIMPRVRWHDLQKFNIPLPSLKEQQLIVDKIESIFAEIDSAMRHVASEADCIAMLSHKLDSIKLSILDREFKYAHYQNYKDATHKTVKTAKLSDIVEINPQKPPSGSVLPTTNVAFVPMRCIGAETGKIESHIIKQYHEVSKGYHYFQNSDILFAKITPCMENGKIALANDLINNMGFATTEVYVIRLKNNEMLPKFYLWYLMQPKLRHYARLTMSGSAGQLRMPLAFLKEVIVPVPPPQEQLRTVAKIESIFSKIDAEKAKITELQSRTSTLNENVAQIKESILNLAFSGKLLPDNI